MSGLIDFTTSTKHLVCNYTFTRKYINNIGGPWIATFVNHYTVSQKYLQNIQFEIKIYVYQSIQLITVGVEKLQVLVTSYIFFN